MIKPKQSGNYTSYGFKSKKLKRVYSPPSKFNGCRWLIAKASATAERYRDVFTRPWQSMTYTRFQNGGSRYTKTSK